MDRTISNLQRELATIRAGRANAQLLDNIMVDYYGTMTPIPQVGNVSIPEPRVMVIAPWDASVLTEVEKAIQTSDLGINPMNDGKIIRLVFPEVTGEQREELVKVARKRAEEAKIAIRSIRRDANTVLKQEEQDALLSEDEHRTMESLVQELTDDKTEAVEDILDKKEKEITEI